MRLALALLYVLSIMQAVASEACSSLTLCSLINASSLLVRLALALLYALSIMQAVASEAKASLTLCSLNNASSC